MISLPRDLWVQYQEICTVGNQGKLNAVYFCASNDGEDEQAGAEALMAKAGEITGLDIQYYVHLNFTAVVEAVDAVGGVYVTIESSDPRGILDRNFDWKCNYTCYYVNYENGETVHLDGEHALALARARNAAGGYGLPNGNFDREKNQQMIVKALLEKAVSAGTLTNLGAVTGLIDAMGNNLRTNIQTKEIRTLMDLGTKIPQDSIVSLSLVEEGNMLVTTGSYNGQSIVRPVAGLFDYSQIAAYVERSVTAEPYMKEEPHVTILNGSGTAGVAQTLADTLTEKGFIVDAVDNAPEGSYDAVEIYTANGDKPASADKLKELYGVTLKTTPAPVSVVGETNFVIIIGDASAVQ
ncbi:LCP family protein [Candidatus Saccharibacteria bacterium]|nr:LCP family protein [Candidatus Saccharibacteria bacterium]